MSPMPAAGNMRSMSLSTECARRALFIDNPLSKMLSIMPEIIPQSVGGLRLLIAL